VGNDPVREEAAPASTGGRSDRRWR